MKERDECNDESFNWIMYEGKEITKTHISGGCGCCRNRGYRHRRVCCSLGFLKHICDCKARVTYEINKRICWEITRREEKEDLVEVKEIYLWPQPPAHHHHCPRQNQNLMSLPSESSKTSSNPSLEEKSALGPRVAELGIEDQVTTKGEPSFTARERAMKGLLANKT